MSIFDGLDNSEGTGEVSRDKRVLIALGYLVDKYGKNGVLELPMKELLDWQEQFGILYRGTIVVRDDANGIYIHASNNVIFGKN